ncbi:MAG: methyltransferase domain-containing protein [Ktedonobacteraceae bacterium]|nr:methyltransferase domain-containing protein [Ktedonobacteraceae bacterium]
MTDVLHHYNELLAAYYTWMFGDFAEQVEEQRTLFERWGVKAKGGKSALDLGCGSGFQSIALADLGFRVTAVDLNAQLLKEVEERKGARAIIPLQADIRALERLVEGAFDVIVCMGDTLTHLESRDEVLKLFEDVRRLSEGGGRCILGFRDLSTELKGVERFIPVRSDGGTIMTCFLEYQPERVLVHDLIYTRVGEAWILRKSVYPKLRLERSWVIETMEKAGFTVEVQEVQRGMCFVVAH